MSLLYYVPYSHSNSNIFFHGILCKLKKVDMLKLENIIQHDKITLL